MSGHDWQKAAMQSAIGEYRAFLWSLTDPSLTPVVRRGVRTYARKLLDRHGASEDAQIADRPRIPLRPAAAPVYPVLQCEKCLKLTPYAEFKTRITNPGRCNCGGPLRASA